MGYFPSFHTFPYHFPIACSGIFQLAMCRIPPSTTSAAAGEAPYAPVPAPPAPTTPGAAPAAARPPLPSRIRSPPGGVAGGARAEDEGGAPQEVEGHTLLLQTSINIINYGKLHFFKWVNQVLTMFISFVEAAKGYRNDQEDE